MAHRGNREACPENTLASFSRAIADEADILETDLHVTRDGELVCIHDRTLERTTDGTGRVADKSLRELKQLSASCGRTEFRGETIPTLRELAAILPPDRGLALELKSDAFLERYTCEKLFHLLRESRIESRTCVLSFSEKRIRAIQQGNKAIPTGFITLNNPWPRKSYPLLGPFWPILLLNPLYVWIAQKRGQLVCPLDPKPEPRLWFYLKLGVDALLTDNPAKTRQALGRFK